MDVTITLTDEQVADLKNRSKTGRDLHIERRNQMLARGGRLSPQIESMKAMTQPALSPEDEVKQLVTSIIVGEISRVKTRAAFTKKLDEAKAKGLQLKGRPVKKAK
jgi:hypothetical protein